MLEKEKRHHHFNSTAPFLKYRNKLVDMLFKIVKNCQYTKNTFFSSLALLDSFLSRNHPDNSQSLNALVLVIVSIASKSEENTYFSLKQLLGMIGNFGFKLSVMAKIEVMVFKALGMCANP